jgi:hypothetical protein
MKIPLELNVTDSGIYLNYWNSMSGDDVVCQIEDGKLIENDIEISFAEFVTKVLERNV